MLPIYELEVRGKSVTVGSYTQCMEKLLLSWGWVPLAVFEAVVRPKITYLGAIREVAF